MKKLRPLKPPVMNIWANSEFPAGVICAKAVMSGPIRYIFSQKATKNINRHLAVRDLLRACESERIAYADLKGDLLKPFHMISKATVMEKMLL